MTSETFVHQVQRGEHALLVFHTPEERLEVLRAYIRQGIRENERIVLIAHPDTPDALRARLQDIQGFEDLVARGQLLVFPGTSFHEGLGTPTRAGLDTLHRQLVEAARKDGYEGLRALVDVTYYVETGNEAGLRAFEQAIGGRFPYEMRLLCLLDAHHAPRELAVLEACHTAGRVRRAD